MTRTLPSALKYAADLGETECFIIGGSEIYRESIELADRIYLTKVHTITEADVFFPKLVPAVWISTHSEDIPDSGIDEFPTTFMILKRQDRVSDWKN
jgi:dihydrofolate reductase